MECIAAVSGGPDSMALLDWMEEQKLDYGVCHVNYHHRDSANRDERIVRDWCQSHLRPLLILHPCWPGGNFQGWAREVRYAFFAAAGRIWKTDRVYLGHQQDDLLETWMIQKERNALPSFYGLKERNRMNGLLLIRPFLLRTKQELLEACQARHIEWGQDESNLRDDYLRNRIRHQTIEQADAKTRAKWLKQIEEDNRILCEKKQHAANLMDMENADRLLSDPSGWMALWMLLHEKTGKRHSKKELEDLIEKLKEGHLVTLGPVRLQVYDHRLLMREGYPVDFWIGSKEQLEDLCRSSYSFGTFRLSKTGGKNEAFSVFDSDFPLEIRSFRPGDRLNMKFGSRRISRFLIDQKVPRILRPEKMVIAGQNGSFFAVNAGCESLRPVENDCLYMLELNA